MNALDAVYAEIWDLDVQIERRDLELYAAAWPGGAE